MLRIRQSIRYLQRSQHPERALPLMALITTQRRCQSTSTSSDMPFVYESNSSNLYVRLGFSPSEAATVDKKAIKRNYRLLAQKYHPDSTQARSTTTDAAFQKIQEAYDNLKDDDKRKLYDEFTRRKGGEAFTSEGFSNYERTRSQHLVYAKVFKAGVPVFLLGLFVMVMLTTGRSRQRLEGWYFHHFVAIFLMIRMLPVIFSAAILYILHVRTLERCAEAQTNADAVLVVKQGSTGVSVAVTGLPEDAQDSQLVCTVTPPASNVVQQNGQPAPQQSQTFHFAQGVHEILLPKMPAGTKVEVKGLTDVKKLNVMDKSFVL